MTANPPLISVVIAAYNAEQFLRDAIESVRRQSYGRKQVILIDDGSTDGTARIAKTYDFVVYLYQPNTGVASALNKGIGLSGGSFLAFLDADDMWTENKLALQIAEFESDPSLEAVFGAVEQFRTNALDGTTEVLGSGPGVLKGAMLIRQEAFRRVGLFDSQWRYGDFIEWFTRAQEAGLRTKTTSDVVLRRRIHADNMGIRERQNQIFYVNILKAALDRRRQREGNPSGDKR